MKHPLWIINSSLLALLIIVLGVIFLMRVRTLERESIEPEFFARPKAEATLHVNAVTIYENDLFNTYHPVTVPSQEEEEPLAPPLPPAPIPENPVIPPIVKPQFLDPLNVTLKGIITISSDPAKNSAIIANNKNNIEQLYKVGDTIEDAQLIRITGNKIVLLRSNGQQEVLYLREQDAQTDPAYITINDWQRVVHQVSQYHFLVNPTELIIRIQDLSQFIDMLSLTTAYKDGVSVGSYVGVIEPNSLGTALGLESYDIITTINGIPATTTQDRIKIYKSVVDTKAEGTITVHIVRKGREIVMTYTVRDFVSDTAGADYGTSEQERQRTPVQDERKAIIERKYRLAPSAKEIREFEKSQIMRHSRTLPKQQTEAR